MVSPTKAFLQFPNKVLHAVPLNNFQEHLLPLRQFLLEKKETHGQVLWKGFAQRTTRWARTPCIKVVLLPLLGDEEPAFAPPTLWFGKGRWGNSAGCMEEKRVLGQRVKMGKERK